jgi:hypothetical protein
VPEVEQGDTGKRAQAIVTLGGRKMVIGIVGRGALNPGGRHGNIQIMMPGRAEPSGSWGRKDSLFY